MKVYLVTSGSYSDYHVVTVFSGRESAEECARLLGGGPDDGARVEEYALDPEVLQPLPGLLPWMVGMVEDGSVAYAMRHGFDNLERLAEFRGDASDFAGQSMAFEGKFADGVQFQCWARDEGHAVKIASERRAALVASGEWDQVFDGQRRSQAEWERRKAASWHREAKVLPGEPEA